VVGLAVVAAACGGSVSAPVLPESMAGIVSEYRLTYVSEVVERFGLTEEDLARIDVGGIDPTSWEEFPSRVEFRRAQARWTASCLESAGFAVSVVEAPEGPGVDFGRVGVEDPDFRRVLGLCLVEGLLRFPPRPEPVSEEEWRVVYEEQVATARCLAELGFPGEIPSFDAFRDNPSAWVAYDAVAVEVVGPGRWAEINERCPQP